MSTVAPAHTRVTPVATIVLCGLLVVPYLMMLASSGNLDDHEAMSRGLAAVFCGAGIVLTWILLAPLLLLGVAKGEMPRWAAVVAFLLYAGSFAAAIASLVVLSDDAAPQWPVVALAGPPPLIAGYSLWARLPELHAGLTPHAISLGVWGLVLLLSIGPWVAIAERPARLAAARAIAEAVRPPPEVPFEQLTPESSLYGYIRHFGDYDLHRDEALRDAKHVRTRQTDAETLLREGAVIKELWRLDIEPTGTLCAAYNEGIRKVAAEFRRIDPSRGVSVLDPELPNMRWLAVNRCDLGAAIDAAQATARAASRDSGRNELIAELEKLRRR